VSARVPPPAVRGGDAVSSSVLAHQPDLLAAFQRLYGTLWSHGTLDQPTKEVARLRNARVTGCGYCRNVRFSGAREQGLSEELVALIDDGYAASELSGRHKAAIRFTDAFLRHPGEVDDETRRELLEHFTPAEIVELAAGVALFMGFSKIAVALGQAPESMPTLVVPTPERPPER
jgi:AhpD family alkylhydroperoxidase